MWVVAVRKSDWVFQIFNLLLSRNHKIWSSKKSKSTDFFLWEIEFSDMKYDDEKKHCNKKELM